MYRRCVRLLFVAAVVLLVPLGLGVLALRHLHAGSPALVGGGGPHPELVADEGQLVGGGGEELAHGGAEGAVEDGVEPGVDGGAEQGEPERPRGEERGRGAPVGSAPAAEYGEWKPADCKHTCGWQG